MATLSNKKDLSDKEHVVKYCMMYLGMKKSKPEAVEKALTDIR